MEGLELREKLVRRNRLDADDWERIIQSLPGKLRAHATSSEKMRRYLEAALWVADTGAGWKAIPKDLGTWRGNYIRFIRWTNAGVWSHVIPAIERQKTREMLDSLVVTYLDERKFRQLLSHENAEI